MALARHLHGAQRMIAEIRETLGSEAPPIVVGGSAFRGDPERWKQVGADLYLEDATTAVVSLRSYKARIRRPGGAGRVTPSPGGPCGAAAATRAAG